jgi:hypothetical protein
VPLQPARQQLQVAQLFALNALCPLVGKIVDILGELHGAGCRISSAAHGKICKARQIDQP